MLLLIANLGSTSFKYKLFDMGESSERVLAQGGADRIGQGGSSWSVTVGDQRDQGEQDLADHSEAIELHLGRLQALGAISELEDVQAVGFKAVHGGPISGAVEVDAKVIETMNAFADVAPAHNPPYVAAMEAFRQKLPGAK